MAAEAQNVDQPDLEVGLPSIENDAVKQGTPRRWMVVVVLRNVDLVAAFANVRVFTIRE